MITFKIEGIKIEEILEMIFEQSLRKFYLQIVNC